MTPAAIINAATADGVTVALSPVGTIKAVGVRSAVDKWLPVLREHKPALVRILKAGLAQYLRDRHSNDRPWESDEWRAFFEERAAIVEFDGGYSRAEAEAQAFTCCVVEWLNRNPISSDPGRCLSCGKQSREAVLPFDAHGRDHAWLHASCWTSWREGRKADAVAALMAAKVVLPSGPHPRANRGSH